MSNKLTRRWWPLLMMVLASVLASLTAHPARAVPVRVTYADGAGEGFNDADLGSARRRAFEAAAAAWGRLLAGSVPVEIAARMDSLGGSPTLATLGQAGPANFVANWNGTTPAPVRDTYYATALANQLAGIDLAPDEADILATFNSDIDGGSVLGGIGFYYGLDARPVGPDGVLNSEDDPIDFFSVVLHEFGHGLGFVAFINPNGSFDQSLVGIFDRFLVDGPTSSATRLLALSQDERGAILSGNNLYFGGPNARAAGGGRNAKLYAPNPYENGSSVSHLDEATYSGINELMTPQASSPIHTPGPITLGIFRDLGWRVDGAVPNPTATPVAPTPTPIPIARPTNDDFARATVLSVPSGRVRGSNINATKQSGEPNHASNVGGASIWYRWTAPADGTVTFSTASSNFDTTLAAYLGTSVNALTLLAQNDDLSSTDVRSSIRFAARKGAIYFVAVDGYSDADGISVGAVVLDWNFVASVVRPSNDDFARPAVLSGVSGRVTGNNSGASKESGEPNHAANAGGASLWYLWRAPATARWTFTTTGSGFDTLLAIYSGTSLHALTLVGNDDDDFARTSTVSFDARAGTIYRIAIDGKNGARGNVVLSWMPAPRNDQFASATLLTVANGRLNSGNIAASREVGEPRHAAIFGTTSIWYRWRAPQSGLATFSTVGSGFDTLLGVYTGDAVNALRPLASNDNFGGAATSVVRFNAVAGTIYNIAIDGKAGASGALVLQWATALALPPNDNFARAQSIDSSAGSVTGSNLNATREAGEMVHGGVGVGRSVWYSWLSPGNGRAFFSTTGSGFDTVLAVYAFDDSGVLRAVANNDDVAGGNGGSVVSFPVGAGLRYFVAVDGANKSSVTSGAIKLSWAFRP